jgi:hypothetical protein
MSGAGGYGDGVSARKKFRLAESESEQKHAVSVIQMGRGKQTAFLRAYLFLDVTIQGGDQVCRIMCSSLTSALQLKAKVEVEAGLKAAALATVNLPA